MGNRRTATAIRRAPYARQRECLQLEAQARRAIQRFEAETGRIAELVSRMDERAPRMAATEDRLRRTMETILDRIGDHDGVPDQEPPA